MSKIHHTVHYGHLMKVLRARRLLSFGEGYHVHREIKVRLASRAQCPGDGTLYPKVATHARKQRITGEAA